MTSNTILVEPTAHARAQDDSATSRFESVLGMVVGFVDNAKPNFDHLAAAIGELLTREHGVARVLTHRKRSASLPVAQDALERMTAECDLVIAGSGD